MNRVFIQVRCRYPRGDALANYIQSLVKGILNTEHEVILAADYNQEYDLSSEVCPDNSIVFMPIMPSMDADIHKWQRLTGYCEERLGVLKEYKIDKDDIVIVLGLTNEYFLNCLFEFKKKIGFKIICGVLELFGAEDFNTREEYKKSMYIKGEVYLQANAILSISEYIDKYYIDKGMRVFRLPPMIDSKESEVISKNMDKYRFIIPSPKDSLKAMLMAFAGLEDKELSRVELHLCGIQEAYIEEILDQSEWERLKQDTVVHSWLKYDELIEIYHQIHFLLIARNVCQRTLANFPSKVPETMLYGVVPVVSNVGDYTKYYLKNGMDSVFIDGDSIEEIKKMIRKAIGMTAQEYESYSKSAYQTARTRFDYHVWRAEIKRMLESV